VAGLFLRVVLLFAIPNLTRLVVFVLEDVVFVLEDVEGVAYVVDVEDATGRDVEVATGRDVEDATGRDVEDATGRDVEDAVDIEDVAGCDIADVVCIVDLEDAEAVAGCDVDVEAVAGCDVDIEDAEDVELVILNGFLFTFPLRVTTLFPFASIWFVRCGCTMFNFPLYLTVANPSISVIGGGRGVRSETSVLFFIFMIIRFSIVSLKYVSSCCLFR
jgi:hypothetical protein